MANLKQIEKFLKHKGLKYKVIDLGAEVYTVAGVSETGVDEEEIVKTLIVRIEGLRGMNRQNIQRPLKKMQFVALAVRGCDRVDFKKVRRLFGNKSELAKADEVLEVAGVPIGAVCPILVSVPLYFDRRAMRLSRVNMGSGDLRHGLEMELGDLLEAVGEYETEDLVDRSITKSDMS